MKHVISLIFLIFLFVFVTGCTTESSSTNSTIPTVLGDETESGELYHAYDLKLIIDWTINPDAVQHNSKSYDAIGSGEFENTLFFKEEDIKLGNAVAVKQMGKGSLTSFNYYGLEGCMVETPEWYYKQDYSFQYESVTFGSSEQAFFLDLLNPTWENEDLLPSLDVTLSCDVGAPASFTDPEALQRLMDVAVFEESAYIQPDGSMRFRFIDKGTTSPTYQTVLTPFTFGPNKLYKGTVTVVLTDKGTTRTLWT
jgi:hypothetical protein